MPSPGPVLPSHRCRLGAVGPWAGLRISLNKKGVDLDSRGRHGHVAVGVETPGAAAAGGGGA
eukprot:871621-Alexandrium_andersonii.AAC.1